MSGRALVLTLCGLFISLFLASLDASIVNTALPSIVSELHGFELYAWVTTGYLLGSTAVVPVVGKLGDRYGRRPILIGGVAYFLVTSTLCGLAQDMLQLIALRTLQGIGGGIVTATVFASLGQLLSPVSRARIGGLITAVYSTASIIGPLVGGYLTDAYSWRAAFLVNIPFALGALGLLWWTFPDVRPSSSQRLPIDVWGAVTIVAATTSFLLGIGRGTDGGLVQVMLLTAAAVLLALFVLIETRAIDPVLPLRLLRNSVITVSAFGSLAQSMGTFSASLFIPLFLQAVVGTSATVSGGLLAPMALAMLGTNLVTGLLIAQVGRYRVFAVSGFVVGVVGYVLLSSLGPESAYGMLVTGMVLIGVSGGLIVSTLALSAQNAASYEDLGVVTSLVQFSRAIGNTLGSAVLGSILVLRFGPELNAALPADLAAWVSGAGAGLVRDPQALLDASAAAALRAALGDGSASDVLLRAIREGLAGALHWVFVGGAVVMASGFVACLFLRDIPFRRQHHNVA